jgi:hypothetical protein
LPFQATRPQAAIQGSANATDTKIPAKSAERLRGLASQRKDEEHAIGEALNQKSPNCVQSGQTPDFAAAEPASHQQG